VAIVSMTLIVGCSSNEDEVPVNNSTSNQVASIAANGSWRVTYYYDNDHEETSNYSGYSFNFDANGAVIAVSGNTTVTGTWSITDNSGSSSDDDGNSSSNDNDFNIFFASPPNFEELSDDWDIISVSNTKIELIDVSGGNGGTDYLTFEKN